MRRADPQGAAKRRIDFPMGKKGELVGERGWETNAYIDIGFPRSRRILPFVLRLVTLFVTAFATAAVAGASKWRRRITSSQEAKKGCGM
jgi:hypothetical protein